MISNDTFILILGFILFEFWEDPGNIFCKMVIEMVLWQCITWWRPQAYCIPPEEIKRFEMLLISEWVEVPYAWMPCHSRFRNSHFNGPDAECNQSPALEIFAFSAEPVILLLYFSVFPPTMTSLLLRYKKLWSKLHVQTYLICLRKYQKAWIHELHSLNSTHASFNISLSHLCCCFQFGIHGLIW